MDDEETASVLGGAYAVLVIEAGVPKCPEVSLFPCFGLSSDHWVVFVKGGIVLVKQCRYLRFILVGRGGEYKTVEFDGFRVGEVDRETRLEEEFLTPLRSSSFG